MTSEKKTTQSPALPGSPAAPAVKPGEVKDAAKDLGVAVKAATTQKAGEVKTAVAQTAAKVVPPKKSSKIQTLIRSVDGEHMEFRYGRHGRHDCNLLCMIRIV